MTIEIPWERVDKQLSGCWLWTGAKIKKYGQWAAAHRAGYSALAHRAVYELLVGPVPQGRELDHTCKTPACVNPAHLEAVTHKENIHRHHGIQGGTCKRGHAWVEENWIRKAGGVQCKPCNREKQRQWREKNRRNRS